LADAAPTRLNDIDHFIILMQENRSFDHYFGSLRGVRGFDDANAAVLPNGQSVFRQPDAVHPDGFVLPFHLDTATTSAQQLHDLSHEWGPQHDCLNGGKMDGWLAAHRKVDGPAGPLTMGYHTRDDLPFYYALADAFTICDGYHCSLLGPTYPNRLYFMSASIDPGGTRGGPALNNDAIKGGKTYTWETYPEFLRRGRRELCPYDSRRAVVEPESVVAFGVHHDVRRERRTLRSRRAAAAGTGYGRRVRRRSSDRARLPRAVPGGLTVFARGYVCGDTFDHTSILRLLESRFGVEVPNLTAWRRATCGDLTSAFGFGEPPRLGVPPFPETTERLERILEVVPSLPRPNVPQVQQLPVQEPGLRPRRGLISRR
jgi:phospholipase C